VPLLSLAGLASGQCETFHFVQARFRDQKLALVIAIGADAMDLFRRYRNQIFPSTALLALLEERRIPRSNLTTDEGAIGSSTDFTVIMENILQVLPDTVNVAVVIGNSFAEKYWLEQMRVAFKPFAGRVSFVWFNDLSLNDMINHAAMLPPRSAIFFYSLLTDGAGEVHEEDVVLSQLHSVANAPIFTWYDVNFGNGIVGGPLISVQDRTQKVVNVAARILQGEGPDQIRMPAVSLGPPKYDWREIQRWGISESRLPPGSTIYFRDPSAWDQYEAQILAVTAAILVQASLIGWLVHERQYRRRAERASRETISELSQLNRMGTAGELSATIAHEVNQPLMGMVTRANAALRWLSGEKPNVGKAQDALNQIVAAGHRASDVVTSVRAMFKKDTQEKGPIDINQLIRSVLGLVYIDLRKHSIDSRADLADSLPAVIGNEVQLQQVILNLVTLASG
jgi:signal transduction histidine kinase